VFRAWENDAEGKINPFGVREVKVRAAVGILRDMRLCR